MRMLYNLVRRRSLGLNAAENQTAGDVLRYCIASIRERHPSAEPRFDGDYFGVAADALPGIKVGPG